ncbi:MAG: translocation/assembly module TamB domain-containing protein, partial [Bacteroidaceae bacterium]
NTRLLTMRGNLNILNRTNVSYILKDSPLSVEDRLGDLVKFVSFRDTTTTVSPTSTPLGLNMLLSINVSDAARAHCDLSSDGQSYIDLEGGGQLTMKYTPQGEMSLTGRYTVNSGEMKYALPVIPLKTFTLTNGSSISFTGDALNPVLNISAKERIKASVSEDGNARNVAFDVGVELTKPLDQMGLEFTIEAPEDLTVQNQLAAMSREQRAKLSVSMLATGMYLAENNNTAFNANNALNSFLQSEIQNIAGNALKTIDLSVGVEDGTSADGSSRTDYSFRFAKRFWGNRVSVIIGGKVSAGGSSTDNQAESFIDNVSLEYRLDKSSSRYVKVFYDRNSQDPLEGQIVTTGAGLVLRKKTNNLGELFIFRKSKDHKKLKKERK